MICTYAIVRAKTRVNIYYLEKRHVPSILRSLQFIYERKIEFREEFARQRARANTSLRCKEIHVNTCDNEDFHSLTNIYMYVKFSLIVEYDLLENDRK